ncbi:putative Insect cuticle protein domain-containing protein 19 [Homarus americanus]|uniref:Putative Insect cuticle protein domain-containing protein 19 n=2 Tax=Homarus americanus TaxID=6706 RepID=A0A8J5TLW1_HOMAM|nr:putative Insect cuticle protein domain-containing protein 19 [Homarus americanus]
MAMPQVARDNTFTKILSFESFQDGNNFGHELAQEDGTTSGQKIGPDGLLYGFYSYIQQDGNRVKVLWRAGEGVGYEVLGVEGLNQEGLGNLRAHNQPSTAPRTVAPRPAPRSRAQSVPRVPPTPSHAPVHIPRTASTLPQGHFMPTPAPIYPQDPSHTPHRFDYPAVLNLERTGTGYVSSLTAA